MLPFSETGKNGENKPVEELLRPPFSMGEVGAKLFGTPNTARESNRNKKCWKCRHEPTTTQSSGTGGWIATRKSGCVTPQMCDSRFFFLIAIYPPVLDVLGLH